MAAIPPTTLQAATTSKQSLQRKLEQRRSSVLAGPPGTGKTKLLLDVKDELNAAGKLGIVQMVQFHREYSYQDFIEGYKATKQGFEPKNGIFKQFIHNVQNRHEKEEFDTEKIDLFIIDEMNRADVGSVFGEVLTLLDDSTRKNITLARSGEQLLFYSSGVILGTMNTADKSIALLDFALRRRFAFIFIPPDYSGLHTWLLQYSFEFDNFTIEEYVKAIQTLNTRIAAHPLLGKGMMLGQSLFVPRKLENSPFTLDEIAETVVEQVLPQLEAYLGFGAQRELDKLIGIELRQKIESASYISSHEVAGLIKILSNDQDTVSL
jgi:5-methylcytosine-specific restriction protein B